ncbi:MAG: MFS transporter [Prevotella sp.]|nr:MFS transporter [Prevotella sp.]
MNSQNTPVHIRLWHRDFWLMAIANLLLTMSVYMLIPTLPHWLTAIHGLSALETGIAMGAFGFGLFGFGAFASFLVQRFRRNMVCVWAVLSIAALIGLLYYVDIKLCQFMELWFVALQRFLLGACFGLAQMVLSSTLIIDTCESYQRTEANHSASWFSRFALALGPLAGLLLERLAGFETVLIAAGGVAAVAAVLILLVSFPFRAPDDNIPMVSLDRFFLPHGFPLFANLQLVTLAMGLLLSVTFSELFFAMMMVGFLLAIVAQRFVFRDAEVKSEVISGLLLMGAALLMMLTRTQQVVWYAAPVFVGFGLGIIGSRFLLFFIKLSRHCQRGTSQSTFLLGWESGLAWGLGLGLILFEGDRFTTLLTSLVLVAAALVVYDYTHRWFVRNKNR